MTKMRVYSYEMHSKTNQGEKKTKDPTYPTIGSSASLSVSAMLNTHHHSQLIILCQDPTTTEIVITSLCL